LTIVRPLQYYHNHTSRDGHAERHASADKHDPRTSGIVTGSHKPFEASLAELFGCVVLYAIGDTPLPRCGLWQSVWVVSAAGDVQRCRGCGSSGKIGAKIPFLRSSNAGYAARFVSLKQRFVSNDFSNPSGFHQRHLRLDIAPSSCASFNFNDA
jgi:hypothetical protein